MLVLTRSEGQTLDLTCSCGTCIQVSVQRGKCVRIGIEAPRTVKIDRHEADEELKNKSLLKGDQCSSR